MLVDRGGRARTCRCRRRCRASSRPGSTRSAAEEKALLQDAAVIGKVFWAARSRWRCARATSRSACTSSSARSSSAARASPRSPARASTPSGTCSSATSPTGRSRARPARDKHRSRRSGSSARPPEDHAEMLAHHYGAALDYARAAGQDTARSRSRARIAFREAGDRAFALNAFARRPLLHRALELWPEDASPGALPAGIAAPSADRGRRSRQETLLEEAARPRSRRANSRGRRRRTPSSPKPCGYGRGNEAASTSRARVRVRGSAPTSPAKARVLTSRRVARVRGADEEAFAVGAGGVRDGRRAGLAELVAARALHSRHTQRRTCSTSRADRPRAKRRARAVAGIVRGVARRPQPRVASWCWAISAADRKPSRRRLA